MMRRGSLILCLVATSVVHGLDVASTSATPVKTSNEVSTSDVPANATSNASTNEMSANATSEASAFDMSVNAMAGRGGSDLSKLNKFVCHLPLNCYRGHGAVEIDRRAIRRGRSFSKCAEACNKHRACVGFVYMGSQRKCWRRSQIQLSKCE